MSPRRAAVAALIALASCHAPRASAPTRPPVSAGPAAAPAGTVKPPGVDDDALFESAAEDDDDAAGLETELTDLAKKSATSPARAAVPVQRWDHKTAPKNLDRVVEHLGLTAAERKKLETNGFVALGREEHHSYGTAFHRIHQEELPLYVSVDAILHALFRSHEAIMMQAEMDAQNDLGELLPKLRAEIGKASYPADVAHDLDLYLLVAERLLSPNQMPANVAKPVLATEKEVEDLVTAASEAKGLKQVSLFGRDRLVDFSFFEPRGPYPRAGLSDYFRAMVWLSRIEMNLVSRGGRSSAPAIDPTETPREATVALALTDLVKRTGTMPIVAKLERLYGAFAGPSEAISPMDLERLGQGIALGDVDGAAKQLRAAIGDKFRRTTNYHVRPYFTKELPAIATFIGVGITPDAAAITALTNRGDPRVVRGPDVAYALGVDRAQVYTGQDAQPFLPLARAQLGSRRGPDLYAAWLGAVRGLAKTPKGTLPGFVETPAFADNRVGSMMLGYGEIRHAYALHGVQVYDEGGCKIPDAYVDPAVDVYEGILAYAKHLRSIRDVVADPARIDTFANGLEVHVGALLGIAKDELAGRALTAEQKDYLALVAEHERPSIYAMHRGRPRFNGWYNHLFAGGDAFSMVPFVADYATNVYHARISYLGAQAPVLGVFVVDVGGEPRAMVGPVGRAFERTMPLGKRLTDADDSWWLDGKLGAWEASWLAPAPKEPEINVRSSDAKEVSLSTKEPLEIVVEAVDEHAETIARSAKVRVKPGDDGVSIPLVALEGRGDREHRDTRIRLASGAIWRGWRSK